MDIIYSQGMRRLALGLNIKRLTQFLNSGKFIRNSDYFRSLIRNDRRELARLDAHEYGAFSANEHVSRSMQPDILEEPNLATFRDIETGPPAMIIDPGPDLKILAVNKSYQSITGTTKSKMIGRPVYDIFPENPAAPESEAIANTLFSLNTVVTSRQTDVIAVQRYDIRGDDGDFLERYWRIENTPLFGPEGDISFIRHSAANITQNILEGRPSNLSAVRTN